jgi:hypothetical protein
MAQENVGINITVGGNQDQALGSLKKQLKEATLEVQELSAKFGATSEAAVNAAKKAAELKDQIGDSKALVDAFNPDTKFAAFSKTLGAVAGGFSAVQGALGLLGVEGEDVQKTLVKVQSALALSQGLEQLGDLGDAFKNLKTVAVNAFNGIKAAIGATGIGLLVIAIGSIVTYWDDIKELVSGVGEEQENLNKLAKENFEKSQENLETLEGQTNQLRLQGKSEREILNLKIQATKESIKSAEGILATAESTKILQVQAAERNTKILKGIINFISTPIKFLLGAIDDVGKALGKDFGLVAAQEKANNIMANYIFDPVQTAKEGDATIKEAKATLNKLKEQRDGSILALQNLDKQGASKSKADAEALAKEKLEAEKAALKKLADLRNETFLATFKDENDKKRAELNLAFIKEKDEILANTKITEATRNELIVAARTKLNSDLDKIAATEKEKKDAADKKMLEDAAIQLEKDNEAEYAELQKQIAKNNQNNEKIKADNEAFRKSELEAEISLQNAKFEAVSAGLNLLSSLAGQNEKIANAIFVIDKALAIAKIVVDTQREIAGYYASNSALGPAGVALATKLALVAKIRAGIGIASIAGTTIAKFKGGGAAGGAVGGSAGGSAPSVSAAAPLQPPQPQTTTLSTQSINALGNQATRAYVVESDVTNSQQRMAAIQQRARFG